ncbi:MAG: hypothetical protein H9W81_07410 [Enterococcus sp.]|nr:hypothetical protein [Enterococcus sp.]
MDTGSSILGTLVASVAIFTGGYLMLHTSAEKTEQIDQLVEVGQNYETWALQNPAEAGDVMDGEPYSKITQSVIGEEPEEKLSDYNVFYIRQDDEQYGLCVAKVFDNRDRSVYQEAYIYSTVTGKISLLDDCRVGE